MDTRSGAGKDGTPFGPPSLAANVGRIFPITTSNCGIPGNAQAYSFNVTLVSSGYVGFLSIWPANQTNPYVSTLNAPNGGVVANAAIVPAGDGRTEVLADSPTDVLIDVNGYFAPPNGGMYFYPIPPCRVVDTRPTGGLSTTQQNFPITGGPCPIPGSAQAFSLNVTAVPQGTLFYLSIWPTGQSPPVVSTLNAWFGNVISNAALVPAGTNGNITMVASNATNVLADANGYFSYSPYEGNYVGVSGAVVSSGAPGTPQQFVTHYTSPNGFGDVAYGQMLFTTDPSGPNGSNACQIEWMPNGNLTLVSPDGNVAGYFGGPALGNASCTVDAANSRLTQTGSGYDVTVWVTFGGGFPGSTPVQAYAYGENASGLSGPWAQVGSWLQVGGGGTLISMARNHVANTDPPFIYNDGVAVPYTYTYESGPDNDPTHFDTPCSVSGSGVTATPSNQQMSSFDIIFTAATTAAPGTRTVTCIYRGEPSPFTGPITIYDATPSISAITHYYGGDPVFTPGEDQTAVRITGSNLGSCGTLSVLSGSGVSVDTTQPGFCGNNQNVTNWSPTEIDAYFIIGPTASTSTIGVTADKDDSGNNFQSKPGDQKSQSQGKGQMVVKAVVLTVTVNGTNINPSDTVLVDPTNPPLNISASLANATGTVTWQLHGQYQDPHDTNGYDEYYPFGPLQPVPAGNPYNITRSIGGNLFILWNLNGSGTISFPFTVQGVNPARADILTYLGSNPWFLQLIPGAESVFRQFVNQNPYFGGPHGYGLMQIDPAPDLATLYDWRINADAGRAVVQGFLPGADAFWNRQMTNWSIWNNANPTKQFGLPDDDTEANCIFSATDPPPAGEHSYRDAVWIKRYNAGSLPNPPDNFIYWVDGVGWALNTVNVDGVNYVARVCGVTP